MPGPDGEARTLVLDAAGQRVPTPYDVFGTGPSQALLLPALSSISTRAEMAGLARALSFDHRCIVPDWPGFGARDRDRVPLAPPLLHAFLDALIAALPGPYAMGVAAGHAAFYLAAAAARHPGIFGRLVLVAPTWRGPLPTVMGAGRRPLFRALRRAVETPLLGEMLYRANISRPVIGRMMRAHVYADPANVTARVVAEKHAVTRRRGGRFGTAAFVTGGLDPVETREDFLALWSGDLPPVTLLRPAGAPRRSGAEMDALADALLAGGQAPSVTVPGALAPHEEHPAAVAAAIGLAP
ncbi:alpha/beta fold hydrolase [Methylobacterium sp. sgz302541]|uniref:alpha/beta fold hydrolase n=1 Tax=unclassified Methylobacterium TaxID=2615210 RepID=UPI003D335E46